MTLFGTGSKSLLRYFIFQYTSFYFILFIFAIFSSVSQLSNVIHMLIRMHISLIRKKKKKKDE